jgi:hypothetical protein
LATRQPTEDAPASLDPGEDWQDFQSFSLNSERYQLGSLDDEPPSAPPPLRLPRTVKPSVSFGPTYWVIQARLIERPGSLNGHLAPLQTRRLPGVAASP